MTTSGLLLSQAVHGFLMARRADGYSPQTLNQYQWALDMLIRFSDMPLQQVTTDDLRRFLAAVQENPRLSPTSVFHVWKAIRALFKWTSSEGLSDRPDKALTKPRFAYREILPLSEDEVKALLKAVERTTPSQGKRKSFTMPRATAHRDRAIIMLLLDTGIRASELCRLTVKDIDLNNGTITVRPHLSGVKSRPRVIPIGNATQKALWLYLARRNENDGALFFTREGRPFDRVSLRHLLVRLGDRAGVQNVHPHRFRHTFAIQYLRNGGDVFTLQRILGHSTLKMVEHYLALADTDTRAAHRKASPVDNLWKKG
ncbi:site-specific recombinase XerD [Anaerolinea thermolimosa]|uniref:tyrosine-type recombinase/integrase n=1 Tax=Anaerolinea thermolimosa TaxID=229919 RepID=UPI0007809CB6|nr:tyrosine-type recombinase/integrase [Anaerolinea thermolimosa]GAP05917.1 site-specific recombinase XerD [Anaerolinea thermolimosa]